MKIIWKEFSSYKPKQYKLTYDNNTIEKTAFLITVGNAGQYGNDFYIAPGAKMNDGLFHVSVLRPFKFYQVFGLVLKILRRKADSSKFIDSFACRELTITRSEKDVIHFDGEPEMAGEVVEFKMNPLSLRAITGEKFKDA
ncbi:MAG: hypothetical protein K0S12_1669 [Bacteroidetes bacterium]|nr:hypothetical protein [Bacteroidota bacterium]